MSDEIKDIVKEALEEVLKELSANAKDFITETVFPYVDDGIKDFQDTQDAGSAASTSAWVKIRNKMINTGITIVWSVTKAVVTKILEKAETDEKAIAAQ